MIPFTKTLIWRQFRWKYGLVLKNCLYHCKTQSTSKQIDIILTVIVANIRQITAYCCYGSTVHIITQTSFINWTISSIWNTITNSAFHALFYSIRALGWETGVKFSKSVMKYVNKSITSLCLVSEMFSKNPSLKWHLKICFKFWLVSYL